MSRKNGTAQIPPPRSGRPIGEEARILMALEVGGRAAFARGRDAALRVLASSLGARTGRRYVTRIENERTIAIWRAE